jgi:universal stress protein A
MLKMQTILCPTDFSKPSEYAFRVAGALARDHGARLVILHVSQPEFVYGEMIPPPPPSPAEYKEKIWQAFHKLEETDPKIREVRVETKIVEGVPGDEIVNVAKETGAEMIVMGTHGRTGLRRLLMGSVAEQVLRRAPCPVMTVKAPLPAPAAEPVPAAAARE